jgi:hypothetical protein
MPADLFPEQTGESNRNGFWAIKNPILIMRRGFFILKLQPGWACGRIKTDPGDDFGSPLKL